MQPLGECAIVVCDQCKTWTLDWTTQRRRKDFLIGGGGGGGTVCKILFVVQDIYGTD